jgi:hypothetical protein
MSQLSVISADNHLTIELHPDRWRLVHLSGANVGQVVFEAIVGQPPVTGNDFAASRRLPAEGIPASAIVGVVLGWSPKIGAWQLGLIFTPEFAETRGSRWCELARWNDPDASVHGLATNRAAQALARVMKLPLKVIPPKIEDADEFTPVLAPKPLPPLPLDFGVWSLHREGPGLVFKLADSWVRSRWMRILWYTLWLVVFVALSVLSLTVKLALPNAGTLLPIPQALPYMGLAVAAVLIALIGKNLYDVIMQPNRVIINANTRAVIAARGAQTKWTMTANHLDGIYASEILSMRGKHLVSQYGELNLRLDQRRFRHVLTIEDERDLGKQVAAKVESVIEPLTQNDVKSPLSAAAVYIAQALGDVPAWYDRRTG